MMRIGPSLAGEFFAKLKGESNRSQCLSGFVGSNPPTVETEWLDFKGAERLADSKAKEVFSQALSGFANTQGGVLIFGLDCRKAGDPAIDCVSAFSLVESPEAFASRLMELHHQANDPPVLGVEILPIPHHTQPDKGFVVCFVPESPFRPHRAEFSGRQYYIRAGDDFVVPSVSLLRTLFFPSTSAELVIHTVGSTDYGNPAIKVSVVNTGHATARDVMLTVTGSRWSTITLTDGWIEIQPLDAQRRFLCARSIHPGEVSDAFTFVHADAWREACTMPADFIFGLTFRIYGENLSPTTTTVSYNDDAVAHRAKVICKMEYL